MAQWCSLFLPGSDAKTVIHALQESLRALGYTAFNPFGIMPGLTYPHAVRLFVAAAEGGWVRVIGELDDAQLPMLSQYSFCLLVALHGIKERIEAYDQGKAQPLHTALAPYLKPDVTLETLDHALSVSSASTGTQETDMEFLREAMPEDVKGMQVDTRQAQKMFERLSAGLTQRSGNAGNETAARELLRGERAEWNSAGGARIRAVMNCLTIPARWKMPDFVMVRDAYQLHERWRRNPSAMLYPGDAEAMAAVPNALDYTPVYAGKG